MPEDTATTCRGKTPFVWSVQPGTWKPCPGFLKRPSYSWQQFGSQLLNRAVKEIINIDLHILAAGQKSQDLVPRKVGDSRLRKSCGAEAA